VGPQRRKGKRRLRRGILSGTLIALVALVSLPMSALPALASTTVPQSGGSYCTTCSSASVTTTSAITLGNVLVVSVQAFNSGSTACSTQSGISDTEGNTWTPQAALPVVAGGLNECLFSAISFAPITTGGAPDTITVTFSGAATWIGIQYQELSGVLTTGIVVSAGSAQQFPCTPLGLTFYSLTSKSFSPGSVLVGSFSTDFLKVYVAPSAGSTFTTQVDANVYEAFDEYSTTATSPNTWIASNPGGVCFWVGVGVALPAAPSHLSVPQFPLGLSLLFALVVPAMILLRSRILFRA
jgi:hypothetical protein